MVSERRKCQRPFRYGRGACA